MRSVGGLVFAAGAVVLLVRKSSGAGHWSSFAQFLVALVPAASLYALALAPSRKRSREPAAPEQTVLAVTALLLSPVVFVEFLRWVGASTNGSLEGAGVFAVAALVAAYAAARARVTYAALLAGLAALIAWLLVWNKILDHPSPNTFRWLLIGGAAVLFLTAGALALGGALGASELATAGGFAAVSAGIIGVVISGLIGTLSLVGAGSSSESGEARIAAPGEPPQIIHTRHTEGGTFLHPHLNGAQHLGWDVYLLLVSLALVWAGSRVRVRGLGYVGGLGLGAFLISVAAQLTRLQSGHRPSHDVVGWPLALVLVGAAGLLAGTLGRTFRARSQG
jgi:hypothetical protein